MGIWLEYYYILGGHIKYFDVFKEEIDFVNDFCDSVRYGIEEGYITLSNDDLKNCSDAIENMLSSNDISISMLSSTVSLILYYYLYFFIHRSTDFNEVMNSMIEINELGNLLLFQ